MGSEIDGGGSGLAQPITCLAGQYYKSADKKCADCTANNYCPGGIYDQAVSTDQGMTKCPDDKPTSEAGAKSASECKTAE